MREAMGMSGHMSNSGTDIQGSDTTRPADCPFATDYERGLFRQERSVRWLQKATRRISRGRKVPYTRNFKSQENAAMSGNWNPTMSFASVLEEMPGCSLKPNAIYWDANAKFRSLCERGNRETECPRWTQLFWTARYKGHRRLPKQRVCVASYRKFTRGADWSPHHRGPPERSADCLYRWRPFDRCIFRCGSVIDRGSGIDTATVHMVEYHADIGNQSCREALKAQDAKVTRGNGA